MNEKQLKQCVICERYFELADFDCAATFPHEKHICRECWNMKITEKDVLNLKNYELLSYYP